MAWIRQYVCITRSDEIIKISINKMNEEKLGFEKNGLKANKRSSFPEETRLAFGLICFAGVVLAILFLVGTLYSGLKWGFPVAL